MALDPQIALGYRPPVVNLEVPSPIQQYGQMLTLRGLMEQQQLRGLQIEQERMQLDSQRQANAGEMEFRRRIGAGEAFTPEQTLGVLGSTRGIQYLKGALDVQEARLKHQQARSARLGSIIGSATDAPTYNSAVMKAYSEGFINAEDARDRLSRGFDTKAVEQARLEAMTAEQQASNALNKIKEERETAAAAATMREKGLEFAGQTVPRDPSLWPRWRQRVVELYPTLAQFLPEQHSGANYESVRQFGVKPSSPPALMPADVEAQQQRLRAPQPTPAMSPERFKQEVSLTAAKAAADRAASMAGDPGLIATIKANPQVYETLSPQTKERLAPQLASSGFTDFGAKPSDTELTKIQDAENGIGRLRALRAKINNNRGAMGPISGQLAHWPWATERKKLQADMDVVRQSVGKALEGGVLRKEDEEKYQKILATITDDPDIALYKIDQLEDLMNRDVGAYKASLRAGGRRIPPGIGGGNTVTLKDGRVATFRSGAAAEAFRKDHPELVQ